MGYPCLTCQIVINSTNKFIDVQSQTNGVELITATEATYVDITALCAHLQILYQALGDDWGATTVTVSDVGIITMDSNQSAKWVKQLWKTGIHGSDNADNDMSEILGFDDVDDQFIYSYFGDWQHKFGWYPQRWPAEFGPLNEEAIGGEQVDALSGKHSKKLHVTFHNHYEIVYSNLLAKYVYIDQATGADTNKDFQHCWRELAQSKWFRWREDAAVPGTYIEFYMKRPFTYQGNVIRPNIRGLHSYNFNLRLRRKEA